MGQSFNRTPDLTRMRIEAQHDLVARKHEALSIQASQELINSLKQLGYTDIKFSQMDAHLTVKEPFDGKIMFKVSCADREGTHEFSIDVPIVKDKTILPELKELETISRESGYSRQDILVSQFIDVDLDKYTFHDEPGESYRIEHAYLGPIGYMLKSEVIEDNLDKIEARSKKLSLDVIRSTGKDAKFMGQFAMPTVKVEQVEEKTVKTWLKEKVDENYECDLSKFTLRETHDPELLKVSHQDLGTIGVVERATVENPQELETTLKNYADQFIKKQIPSEVTFISEFKTPEIEKAAVVSVSEPPKESIEWLGKEPEEEELMFLKDDTKARTHDTYREHQEVHQSKIDDEMIQLQNTASQQAWMNLRKAGFEDIKINYESAQTPPQFAGEKVDGKWQGHLAVNATVFHQGDYFDVDLEADVKDNQIAWISSIKELQTLVDEMSDEKKGHKAYLFNKLNKVASQENADVDKYVDEQERIIRENLEPKAKLEKKAESLNSIPIAGLPAVVFFPKLYMPDSTKVGDIIEVSGYRFRVISDSGNKLSAQGTGSYWTCEVISGVLPDKDKAKVHRVINY